MKIIFSLLIALCASSAFAVNFECTKQVSATNAETAFISSGPYLMVGISRAECTSSDGLQKCSTGNSEVIASPYEVCFKNIDADQDCTINETTSSVDVACANGSKMSFAMGADTAGQMTCSENGVVVKAWSFDTCTVK